MLGIDFQNLPLYNLLNKAIVEKCWLLRLIRLILKGEIIMTENKTELIRLILENDNPEQAVLTIANVIFDFLKQHELHQEESSVCQLAACQM